MKTPILISLLLLSAAAVTPASANYFHNPYTNVYLNIGSAPTPTPADIREGRLPQVTEDADKTNDATAKGKTADASAKPEQNYEPDQNSVQGGGAQPAPQASPSR